MEFRRVYCTPHTALLLAICHRIVVTKTKNVAKTVQSQPVCLSVAGRATLRRFVSVLPLVSFYSAAAYNLLI